MDKTYFIVAFGGVLIGLTSGFYYLLHGRIAGISGILFEAINKQSSWRGAFILGLISAGLIYNFIFKPDLSQFNPSFFDLIIGGLLVGIGTRLANGCTSGHGICGISRFSLRSLVAVLVFMAAAIITIYVRLHLVKI
jgi:uncharacterized protein